MKTQLANPIYDVVFKYLMSDEKVARIILRTITGMNITEVRFRPTERKSTFEEEIKRLHIDFAATVTEENGTQKTIIIELQNAVRIPDVIMRFRKYLAEQYASKENTYQKVMPATQETVTHAIPILSIYILGKRLFQTSDNPVVQINSQAIDIMNGKILHEHNEFVDCLTHNSIIIQTPYLNGKRRNDMEKLLSLFASENWLEGDKHIVEINEADYPERFHKVIRKLKQAIASPEMRKDMEAEDLAEESYHNMEKRVAEAEKQAEIAEMYAKEAEKQKEEAEKQKEEERKRAGEERKRAEEAEKQKEEERKRAGEERKRAEEERKRAEEALRQIEELKCQIAQKDKQNE